MTARQQPKRFLLRLDGATYEALVRLAQEEFRSVNGLIEWIIHDALRKRGRVKGSK